MHRDAEMETEMETMMEELPDLSVGGVVCKHYEEPGVAGGNVNAIYFFATLAQRTTILPQLWSCRLTKSLLPLLAIKRCQPL